MHRVDQMKDVRRIITGAVAAVTIGSLFYTISTGAISFFITAVVTITFIQIFKWNAAPIMAVSLIPYFAHPVSIWALPAAVFVSLIGLLLSIWLIGKLEKLSVTAKWSMAIELFFRNKLAAAKEEMKA